MASEKEFYLAFRMPFGISGATRDWEGAVNEMDINTVPGSRVPVKGLEKRREAGLDIWNR